MGNGIAIDAFLTPFPPSTNSANGDNGNLNFDSGSAFSTVIKGSHELDINKEEDWGSWGFFGRGFYYYDFELMDGQTPWQNPLSSQLSDSDGRSNICDDPDARDNACSDLRMLDFFVYADFYAGNTVALR